MRWYRQRRATRKSVKIPSVLGVAPLTDDEGTNLSSRLESAIFAPAVNVMLSLGQDTRSYRK